MSGSNTFSWTLPPGPPLTERQRALVFEALPLAPKVVRRFVATWPSARQYQEELLSVAYEGFIRAAQRFQPGGNSWLSFAYGGAFMQIRAWLQAMKLREMPSFDAPVSAGADITWLELRADVSDDTEAPVFQREVLALVERLPARERIAIQRRLDERRLEEVGAELGYSRAAVHKWEVSAIERLRELLGLDVERTRKKPAPLGGREKLRALLTGGPPRSVRELATLTGYARPTVLENLRRLGAVQVGMSEARAPLWQIPA